MTVGLRRLGDSSEVNGRVRRVQIVDGNEDVSYRFLIFYVDVCLRIYVWQSRLKNHVCNSGDNVDA